MKNLNIPKLDEVIEAANAKDIKPFHIAKATGLAPSTVTRYFISGKASTETLDKIVTFIKQK